MDSIDIQPRYTEAPSTPIDIPKHEKINITANSSLMALLMDNKLLVVIIVVIIILIVLVTIYSVRVYATEPLKTAEIKPLPPSKPKMSKEELQKIAESAEEALKNEPIELNDAEEKKQQ